MQSALEALPDGVMLMDEAWRIVYANRAARRISRIHPEHLNSQTHWQLYPETVGTAVEQTYKATMQDRMERHLPVVRYEPFKIWLKVRVMRVDVGVMLLYQDITVQILAEEAAQASQDRMRMALDAVNGVGTWDWDVPQDRVFADPDFAALYGLDPKRAKEGVRIAEFLLNVHPDDKEKLSQEMEHLLRNGGDFASEYRLTQPDNTTRWVFARGRCTRSADGNPLRFHGIAIDITERKRTEFALMQSEKLAAVGRMASSIAHEINNPLESVMNLLYIARERTDDMDAKFFLDIADRELRRVAVIANQTLRFHKQSSLPVEARSEDLFNMVLSLYEGKLRNSGILVQKRKQTDRKISCFEGDIRQILINLVGNAIDAMPTGGRLHLRCREATDWRTERNGLVMTVADTGCGMSSEVQARIFEAFYTTKGFNGTGLGLWISAEIVERHHGRLSVRSSDRPGSSGTVFALFLPFDMADKGEDVTPSR